MPTTRTRRHKARRCHRAVPTVRRTPRWRCLERRVSRRQARRGNPGARWRLQRREAAIGRRRRRRCVLCWSFWMGVHSKQQIFMQHHPEEAESHCRTFVCCRHKKSTRSTPMPCQGCLPVTIFLGCHISRNLSEHAICLFHSSWYVTLHC